MFLFLHNTAFSNELKMSLFEKVKTVNTAAKRKQTHFRMANGNDIISFC